MSVILVEDDPMLRLVLADILADLGRPAVCYETADAALRAEITQIGHADGPALLITDIRLGGLVDGFALAARMRRQWPDLAVIYISGVPVSPALLTSPRDRALCKPFSMDALKTALDQLAAQAACRAA